MDFFVRAGPDVLRLVELFLAAEMPFFPPVLCRLCPELFLDDAAPIRAPDIAPVRAPASARLRAPPVFLFARFAVPATASRAVLVELLFLFAISYSQARSSFVLRR